ncbi:MAG TPA: LemA family protein [Candidatus Binatia bacterium]|jgi:LemA protein|nr:LemA family protein [Candidatus Binatia bacterium]
MAALALLAILAGAALAAIALYNRFVRLRVQADNAWADVDVQLKRRHDLVPNLVETVKGYAGHERQTLEAVIAARNRALAASGPAAKGEAEGSLGRAIQSLFALAEAYPQLRAVESFGQLQKSLADVEDALQSARRYYNAVVRDLNASIGQFPGNVVASTFGFGPREFFELADEAERAAPAVSFKTGT